MTAGLTVDERSFVLTTIKKQLFSAQTVQVWLFGSRALGSHKKFSDVDLLLEASPPFTDKQRFEIQDAFEESELPYKVDLVMLEDLAEAFRPQIEATRIVLGNLQG